MVVVEGDEREVFDAREARVGGCDVENMLLLFVCDFRLLHAR